MTIKFHFKHEGGIPNGVTLPTNLLLAYKDARRDKLNSILQSICFFILFVFLCLNSRFEWLYVAHGDGWFWTFFVATIVALWFIVHSCSWKGPWATLLFVAINTEIFETYINECIAQMEKMLDPNNRKVSFIPRKEINQIFRELQTAVIIKQLLEESNQITDLYDAINFIADNCNQLYGFVIKEIKND